MTTPEVKLYALSTCSHCKATKDLFNRNHVAYDCVEVDLLEGEKRRAAIEEVKRFNPKCSFPTIVVGDRIIVGFRENEIMEALDLS